jgi:AraC family transcriptional regulator
LTRLTPSTTLYQVRINRVVDYIQQHLHQKLSVTKLARVACFSPYHFHRLFSAYIGETLTSFIQRLRIEKAAFILVSSPQKSVTEIAHEVGFAGSASFARLFKGIFGISASQWRQGPLGKNNIGVKAGLFTTGNWPDVKKADGAVKKSPAYSFAKNVSVSIEDIAEKTVAYVRHIGPVIGNAALFESMIKRLIKWSRQKELAVPGPNCISVYHDDPEITDENKLRVSICISVPAAITGNDEIGIMRIAGGKYAVGHFKIDGHQYADAWKYLFGQWLPRSGFECDDRPGFEIYRNIPRSHPQKKHIVDIYVPIVPCR